MKMQTTSRPLILATGACLCSFFLTGCAVPYEGGEGYAYSDTRLSCWEQASYEEHLYIVPPPMQVAPVYLPPPGPTYAPPVRDRWNLDETLTRPIRSASETVGLGGL